MWTYAEPYSHRTVLSAVFLFTKLLFQHVLMSACDGQQSLQSPKSVWRLDESSDPVDLPRGVSDVTLKYRLSCITFWWLAWLAGGYIIFCTGQVVTADTRSLQRGAPKTTLKRRDGLCNNLFAGFGYSDSSGHIALAKRTGLWSMSAAPVPFCLLNAPIYPAQVLWFFPSRESQYSTSPASRRASFLIIHSANAFTIHI